MGNFKKVNSKLTKLAKQIQSKSNESKHRQSLVWSSQGGPLARLSTAYGNNPWNQSKKMEIFSL